MVKKIQHWLKIFMDAQGKTACIPPPCSLYTQYFHFPFPLENLSSALTCSLDEEAITDSQETKRYWKSDCPAAYWLLASEKVKQMDSHATCAGSNWNTAELLASPSSAPPLNHSPIHQLLTTETQPLNAPGINPSPAAVSAYSHPACPHWHQP